MGWWGIAWTLSRCALNASAGIAKRKQLFRFVADHILKHFNLIGGFTLLGVSELLGKCWG